MLGTQPGIDQISRENNQVPDEAFKEIVSHVCTVEKLVVDVVAVVRGKRELIFGSSTADNVKMEQPKQCSLLAQAHNSLSNTETILYEILDFVNRV